MDNIINYPDLKFTEYCEERFCINRGIYNTIDLWFYEKGFDDIPERRLEILRFLYFSYNKKNVDKGRLNIGKKGLSILLQEYNKWQWVINW